MRKKKKQKLTPANVFVFESMDEDSSFNEAPMYGRTLILDGSGTPYAATASAGDERTVAFSARTNGVECLKYRGHFYVPIWWLELEHPREQEMWTCMRTVLKKTGASIAPE